MKKLYLGNTSSQTDDLVTELAKKNNTVNNGLISCASEMVNDGYYHTTVVDITPAELKKINCEIVLLDQPIESYNSKSEYYATRELIGLKNNYWIDLLKNNKSFCIFPFVNHSTMHDNTTLCCRSNIAIAKTKKFNWADSPEIQDIRKKMINGEKISHCEVCYKKENNNQISDRQSQTLDWVNRENIESIDDLTLKKPLMYDLFPNNKCNLMCRMCGPEFSILIEREQNITNTIVNTNWNHIDIDTAKVIYIAGGEPTAMPELNTFLDKCIEKNRFDIEIRINTNAAKISEQLFKKLHKFSNIIFTISIDGYKEENDYQRWLSSWEKVTKNIKRIIDNGHNINFNVTVSIYTIFGFTDLIRYLNERYKNFIVNCSYAGFENDILNPFVFEYHIDTINDFKSITNLDIYYNNNDKFQNFIDNLIIQAQSSKNNLKKLKEFFDYNDNLDKLRNSQLKDYNPILESKRLLIEN